MRLPDLAGQESGGATALPPPAHRRLREIDLAMAGLTISLFVAHLSNLVVLTALPRIVGDLHGSQASYTWIITASMTMMTVCMPIWGRLSETIDRKRAIQAAVLCYIASSMCAGFAHATWVIIAARAAIGICASGIIVLMQAIAAEIATPRHRARWIGYQGAVIAVATVGAPTLGGFVAQHFGWRWCFFIAVPVALLSIAMVQRTLHLPARERGGRAAIDWAGAALIAGTIVALMLGVSVFGPGRGWASPPALASLGLGAALLVVTIAWERRVARPILPLDLLCNPEVRLGVIAAFGTGFAFFSSAVFLAIFLQLGRGFGPQVAGLMALPEAGAALLAALVASRFIARHGHYKGWLIGGAAMILLGFALLTTIGPATTLPFVGLCIALIGGGLGMVSENLGLVVQTSVGNARAGAAAALVNFFRLIGGIVAVQMLGALLSLRVVRIARESGLLLDIGAHVPRLDAFVPPQRALVEAAYAHAAATVYLACLPVMLVLLVSICRLRNRLLEPDAPGA